jgi:hypothetical protein
VRKLSPFSQIHSNKILFSILANVLAPVVMIVLMLFGGFYVNTANIPDYFVFLEYISFVKYSFAGSMPFPGVYEHCIT